jgi:hypothetical protein
MSDVLGVALVLGGCFCAALGYVLQKKGNDVWQTLPEPRPALTRNLVWLSGLCCLILSSLLVVASAPFLDQSKSAPLGAATLVFNTLLATLILGEKFLVLHLGSTLTIIIGSVAASSANQEPSASLSFAQILSLFDPVAWVFSFLMLGLAALSVHTLRRTTSKPQKEWSAGESTLVSLLAPALGGTANGFVSYGVKAISTVASKGEGGALSNPVFYLYVVLVLVCVHAQVSYLNKGLQYFTSMRIVPIFQCAVIFSNSLCGIVYFGDMRSTPLSLAIFFFGALVCAGGILLLLLNKEAAPASSSSSSDGAGGGGEGGEHTTHLKGDTTLPGDREEGEERDDKKGHLPWPEPSEDLSTFRQGALDRERTSTSLLGGSAPPWYLLEVKSYFGRRRGGRRG